jgi:Uma2 family endonuclease
MKHTSAMPNNGSTAHETGPHSWDDFLRLGDGDRRELVDGHFVEIDMPTAAHELFVSLLCHYLWGWAMPRGALVLASGYKVRIATHRGVMPDVQLFRAENPSKPAQQGLDEGHPDLAVEVISPSSGRFDRGMKLASYASIGVPEYWIVDIDMRVVDRLLLEGDHFVVAESLAEDRVFRPATFEGLEIPLAALWKIVDDAARS